MYSLQLVHLITKKNIKNGSYQFVTGCHGNHPFEEVNDTNQFEARFLGVTIEWE